MKKIMMHVFKSKFGRLEAEENDVSEKIRKDILNDLYEKHYQKVEPSPWMIEHKTQVLKDYNNKMVNEEERQQRLFKAKSKILKKKSSMIFLRDSSRNIRNENEYNSNTLKSIPDSVLIPKPLSSKHKKKPMTQSTKILITELARDKHRYDRKDIREIMRKARELENFNDDFKKIPNMIKMDSREEPKLHDMNKVLANKVQKRYNSTFRFRKIDS